MTLYSTPHQYRPSGAVLRQFSVWGEGVSSSAVGRLIVGPAGSGKTVACIHEIVGRGMREAAPTRWAVIAPTKVSLWGMLKAWEQWYPRPLKSFWSAEDVSFPVSVSITCALHVGIEVTFIAAECLRGVSDLYSLDLTGAWVTSAAEMQEEIFSALLGRVGRYPSRQRGGAAWSGVILDSLPPRQGSWLHRRFVTDRPANFELFRQPGGLSSEAENLENLPPDYYELLASVLPREEVAVLVDGEYGAPLPAGAAG